MRVKKKMCNINKIIEENGLFITFLILSRKLKKILYSIFSFYRMDVRIDISSKILGKKHIKIGKNFSAGKNSWIEAITQYGDQKFHPNILIKDNVVINDFNHIGAIKYIEIGNNVLMGSKCYITDHNHGIYKGEGESSPYEPPQVRALSNGESIIIGDNVWIGDNVVILPGVKIGNGSIIGAHSLITKNIPNASIAVGIPAKVIKKWNENTKRWERED